MKKYYIHLIFLITTLLFFKINFAFSESIIIHNANITDSIRTSMILFLENIPENLLKNYGIKNYSEIKQATFETPIAVYTIENDSIVFTNTWRIPIIIDNEYKSLFTLYKNINNEFKIVDFGATLLAKEFNDFKKENNFLAMLRVFELHRDFIIVENQNGDLKFQPIPIKEKKQYNFKDLILMKR